MKSIMGPSFPDFMLREIIRNLLFMLGYIYIYIAIACSPKYPVQYNEPVEIIIDYPLAHLTFHAHKSPGKLVKMQISDAIGQ